MTVDDSATVRLALSRTLTEAGYEVHEANDGCDALTKLNRCQVDMLVTDLNMPNMDGIILTGKLREIDSYKFTPILILTTETSEARKQEGKAAGATGWIEKPFDPDHLLSTVDRVL